MSVNETVVVNYNPELYTRYPLEDGLGKITLLDWMGGELSVVNDAKASFDKVSTELGKRELKLLKYLLTAKPILHSSPLRGSVFKFRVKAPLYICRQWFKLTIASSYKEEQLGWNERSFRYDTVDDEADYYTPKVFCYQSEDNRQGSASPLPPELQPKMRDAWINQADSAYKLYRDMINIGVSRETARGVLPPCFYTSFVWTTSLQALLYFLTLRKHESAQYEIRQYSDAILELIEPIIPNILKIMGLIEDVDGGITS